MARTLCFKTLTKNVTTAGTQVPLSATKILTSFFRITAKPTNTGYIYWGDKDVDNSCDRLLPGDAVNVSGAPTTNATHLMYNLANIYVDSSVNGEGVIVTYQTYYDE